MNLIELTITQNDIRNNVQIEGMISFVRSGGFWTKESLSNFSINHGTRISPLIAVSEFPDGVFAVHDGHHRAISTWLGGRTYFREDEYVLTKWKYEDYMHINFDRKWVTPFDPRIECRVDDFSAFKEKVFALPYDNVVEFITNNKNMYCQPRIVSTVDELANKWCDLIYAK